MTYDPQNIFAKILRNEIPCQKIYEDEYAIAFPDLYPKAPIHILVIPKGAYISFDHFMIDATPEVVQGFFKAVQRVAQKVGLQENGYRLITNIGTHAHQEVPHFHVHILGGRSLGPLLSSSQ